MDFQESTEFMKENELKQKRKKMVVLGMVLCLLIIAFLGCFIIYLKHVDSVTFKLYYDNKKVLTSKSFVYVEGEKDDDDVEYYINLEEACTKLGYLFQEGSVAITEGEDLYSITTNYEKIDLDVSTTDFTKYVYEDAASQDSRSEYEYNAYGTSLTIRTPKNTKEIFHLDMPLKRYNGSIYISSQDITKILSVDFNWNNPYRLYFYSLQSLYSRYSPIVIKNGFTTMSGDYENIRAMLDGYLIVEKNNKYGVITTDLDIIVEAKYDRILYSQNSKEFFAYANSKVGLIDYKGQQLIPPSKYQDIAILDQNLDQEHRLYKVTIDGKFGVVERNGKELIYPLYDQIGLDSSVELYEKLSDSIILYDKFIPVKQDNKWGYYNLETAELGGSDDNTKKFTLAGFGCDVSNSKTSANQKSVILIPKEVGIKGIVIMYQSGLYGIYDCNVNTLSVAFSWKKIYSDTDNKTGITSYYMESPNGEKVELRTFLEENNLITENGDEEDDEDDDDTTSGNSFTDEMNNLSTEGRLRETTSEDDPYFEEENNTADTEDETSEEGNEENDDDNEDMDNESEEDDEDEDEEDSES